MELEVKLSYLKAETWKYFSVEFKHIEVILLHLMIMLLYAKNLAYAHTMNLKCICFVLFLFLRWYAREDKNKRIFLNIFLGFHLLLYAVTTSKYLGHKFIVEYQKSGQFLYIWTLKILNIQITLLTKCPRCILHEILCLPGIIMVCAHDACFYGWSLGMATRTH